MHCIINYTNNWLRRVIIGYFSFEMFTWSTFDVYNYLDIYEYLDFASKWRLKPMMGKTHIAVGMASSYLICQPHTASEFAIATIAGSLGGVMADIDVKIDKSNKYALKASIDALYGEILAIVISIAALMGDYFTDNRIIPSIISHWQLSIGGAVALLVLIIIGEISKHRDRTHSMMALILFSGAVFLIDISFVLPFAVAYMSHLFIDLFNKSPIRLFYPIKKGLCFKLCYADQVANEVLLIVGTGTTVLYVFLNSLLR